MWPIRPTRRAAFAVVRRTLAIPLVLLVTASSLATSPTLPAGPAPVLFHENSVAAEPVKPELAESGIPRPPGERFDLVCDDQRRVLRDFAPGEQRSTEDRSRGPWRQVYREMVNLDTMLYCDRAQCLTYGPWSIKGVDAERITFYNEPDATWYVRRSDGFSYFRMVTGSRVEEARGYCRREPFSGFPPIELWDGEHKLPAPGAGDKVR